MRDGKISAFDSPIEDSQILIKLSDRTIKRWIFSTYIHHNCGYLDMYDYRLLYKWTEH